MQTVALSQVQAMLTETLAMDGGDTGDSMAVVTMGTYPPRTNRLARFTELAPILGAIEKAIPQVSKGSITLDEAVWKQFESIYYKRVVAALFA